MGTVESKACERAPFFQHMKCEEVEQAPSSAMSAFIEPGAPCICDHSLETDECEGGIPAVRDFVNLESSGQCSRLFYVNCFM